jgi:Fic family protein
MFVSPTSMLPMLPTVGLGELTELALEVIRRSSALGAQLHPLTRATVVELLRKMNSYYSNLIEGHATHPIAIEQALKADYSIEPRKRALQVESAAHIEVQRLIEGRLDAEPELNVTTPEFLCWIHREFYSRVPDELREVHGEGQPVWLDPGELRNRPVQVGRHVPPLPDALPKFLHRFSEAYSPLRWEGSTQVIATGASHHRLAWIHPFLDGNGRVTRLFTDAWLRKARIDGHGLWTVTRGLARHKERYFASLESGDQPRRGDLDGRGALSDEALSGFCRFFLETALDQIDFMSGLLELDQLQKRIAGWVEQRASVKELRPESVHLLREVLLRGEVARGEAARITGLPERTARLVVRQLVDEQLVSSKTEKSALRLGLPVRAVGYWLPRLYPEGVEEGLKAGRET